MRFGLRWPVREEEGGEGGGAGADTTVADDPKVDEPKAPERPGYLKKLDAMRAELKKPEAGEGEAAAEDEGTAGADVSTEGDDPSPGPVRTPKAEPKPEAKKDEKPNGDKAKPADKDGDKAKDPEPLTFALPARRRGEDDVEFSLPRKALEDAGVDVKELGERIAQLRKGYMYGQDVFAAKEEVASDRAEIAELEEAIKADPVAFIAERIEKPELQEAIVERLLTMLPDDAFARLLAKADAMEKDPTKRENARLKHQVTQQTRAAEAATKKSETKADLTTARKIGEKITEAMAGFELDDARSGRLFDYAISRLLAHAKKNKIESLDPEKIPELLRELEVFEDFGLKATAGAKPAAKPKAPGKTPAAQAKDPRDRDKARREATTTPSGDGAPAAGEGRLPKGGTSKEKFARLRERFGIPAKR